jgi:hypothetical protein
MEVCDQRHTHSTLSWGKKHLEKKDEAGWTPRPVQWEERTFVLAGKSNPDSPAPSLQLSHYNDWATRFKTTEQIRFLRSQEMNEYLKLENTNTSCMTLSLSSLSSDSSA